MFSLQCNQISLHHFVYIIFKFLNLSTHYHILIQLNNLTQAFSWEIVDVFANQSRMSTISVKFLIYKYTNFSDLFLTHFNTLYHKNNFFPDIIPKRRFPSKGFNTTI